MEEIGVITSQKISENEFSYMWDLCRVSRNASFRSPTFGTICYEFSDCYLVITLYHSKRMSKSYTVSVCLGGCDVSSTSYNSCCNVFVSRHRMIPCPLKSLNSDKDGASKQEIFHFQISHSLYFASEGFIVKLLMKLLKDEVSKPEPFLLLQEKENHNKSPVLFCEESKKKPYVDDPKELIQDLKSFYNSQNMCDLEIRIDENILRAHKFMLCARSPVFMKMMEHDCLESSSNSITITDCSTIPFKKFLMYLYTGEIEDQSMDTVMPLYSLGDKYDVPALRNACSDILQNKLSESVDDVVNIVCDVLKLADFYNDVKLKDLAASFIVNNFPVVSNKQSWKDLMNSDFKLTSEVLALVVTACQKLKT